MIHQRSKAGTLTKEGLHSIALRDVLRHLPVQRQVGHDLLQPGIRLLELGAPQVDESTFGREELVSCRIEPPAFEFEDPAGSVNSLKRPVRLALLFMRGDPPYDL
jgi:hypothetical protein